MYSNSFAATLNNLMNNKDVCNLLRKQREQKEQQKHVQSTENKLELSDYIKYIKHLKNNPQYFHVPYDPENPSYNCEEVKLNIRSLEKPNQIYSQKKLNDMCIAINNLANAQSFQFQSAHNPSNPPSVPNIQSTFNRKRGYSSRQQNDRFSKRPRYQKKKIVRLTIVGYNGKHPALNRKTYETIKNMVIEQIYDWGLIDESLYLHFMCNGDSWCNWIPIDLFLKDHIGNRLNVNLRCGINDNGGFVDIVSKPYKTVSHAKTYANNHRRMRRVMNCEDNLDQLEAIKNDDRIRIYPRGRFMGTPTDIKNFQSNQLINSDYLIYIPLTNKNIYDTSLGDLYPDHFNLVEKAIKYSDDVYYGHLYHSFHKTKVSFDIESALSALSH
jgi:hypothetical protein